MLLFDENISFRVVKAVQDVFPKSINVTGISGVKPHDDEFIWKHAKAKGYTIVTYDEDFNEIGLQKGYPPKIIWIRSANLSNAQLINLLKTKGDIIKKFIGDTESGCLELYL
jgi:predicted nuclease of predicted toxin-antitoxin system